MAVNFIWKIENGKLIQTRRMKMGKKVDISLKMFQYIRTLGEGGYGVAVEARSIFDNRHYAIKFIPLEDNQDRMRTRMQELSKFPLVHYRGTVHHFMVWDEEFARDENSFSGVIDDLLSKANDRSSCSGSTLSNDICSRSNLTPTTSKPQITRYLAILMELCQQSCLRDWLERNPIRDFEVMFDLFVQIVAAVHFLHRLGYIHRDLKPSNIFFHFDGNIKLGDFGLMKKSYPILESVKKLGLHLPQVQHTVDAGTFLYQSPEQRERPDYTQKSDIYALGVIFFELLVPFGTGSERIDVLQKVRDRDFPSEFEREHSEEHQLLKLLLSPLPNERPSASQILQNRKFRKIYETLYSEERLMRRKVMFGKEKHESVYEPTYNDYNCCMRHSNFPENDLEDYYRDVLTLRT